MQWIKGLRSDVDEVKKVIKDREITYPFAIHFRTASIGGKNLELTHPFPISDSGQGELALSSDGFQNKDYNGKLKPIRRVLMHNGHIGSWKNWLLPLMFAESGYLVPDGPWSDSRALAVAVALRGEGILDFIRDDSRVMILDSIPSVGGKVGNPEDYMRLFGNWVSYEKEGYSQSCSTPAKNTKTRFFGPQCSRKPTSDITPISPKLKENSWTVPELLKLMEDVRKDQMEARVLIGN